MNKATKTLGDFIQKEIVIPCYQRGYIWGKKHTGTGKDAVTYMLESLEKGFKSNEPLFIQGITVVEKDGSYVIIDGQQRMTFFYLLLKTLGDEKAFTIRYRSSRGAADDDMSSQSGWRTIMQRRDFRSMKIQTINFRIFITLKRHHG